MSGPRTPERYRKCPHGWMTTDPEGTPCGHASESGVVDEIEYGVNQFELGTAARRRIARVIADHRSGKTDLAAVLQVVTEECRVRKARPPMPE